MFKLGDKVKVKAQSNNNSPSGKGFIISMNFYSNVCNGDINYQVKFDNGHVYNYASGSVTLLKIQVLHAFADSCEEIHWSTKNYTKKEQDDFGYKPAPEFNKTIDLE